ncbi:uncharacterized protein C8R40DRAFT_1263541, partial [Lentinula edodes]|uniref:uncharacterized protein n=1 Tax=Lentinula edodes TaxID=5353 RepID=UPI001E8CBD5E
MELTLQLMPSPSHSFLPSEAIKDISVNSSSTTNLLPVKAFIALQLSGGMGMLLLLVTALASRTQFARRLTHGCTVTVSNEPIHRSRTWYSFCISWVISCFSYCLLFFAMEQFNPNEKPTFGLCLTQAALIYSSPPLTGATTFALLLDVWLMFRTAALGKWFGGRKVTNSLLLAPYILWVILTIGFLIAGGVEPHLVQRDLAIDPYCILDNPVPSPILVCSLTLAFALAVMVVLIVLVVTMRKQATRSSSHPSSAFIPSQSEHDGDYHKGKSSCSRNKEQMSALIVRLIVFGLAGLIAVTISVVFVLNRAAGSRADLALATLPPIGVVIFGSQTKTHTLLSQDFVQLWFNLIRWLFRCCMHRTQHSSDNSTVTKGKSFQEYQTRQQSEECVVIEMDIGPNFNNFGTGNTLQQDEEQIMISPRRAVIFRE